MLVSILVLGWFVYWNRRLNKLVAERESSLKDQARSLQERVKEQRCLYEFSSAMEHRELPLADQLKLAVACLPDGWQYPAITHAQISYGSLKVQTEGFQDSEWHQTSAVQVKGDMRGSIKVVYVRAMPDEHEGPFLAEERSLIDELAKQLGRAIERRMDVEALEQLNQELESRVTKRTLELEHAQHRNRLILDSAGEGIVGLNADGDITFCNKSGAAMLGYGVKEMVGLNFFDTICNVPLGSTEQSESVSTLIDGEQHDHSLIQEEATYLTKNNKGIPVEFNAVPMMQQGVSIGTVVVFRDNSERLKQQQRLMSSERKFRTLLDSAPDPLIVVDASGHITMVNDQAMKVFEYQREEMLG